MIAERGEAEESGGALGAESPERLSRIEKAVAAFAAVEDLPEEEKRISFSLPKASEKFPFGMKERPVRKAFDLKGWFKGVKSNKASWTNAGPVLVLALLVFCMLFVQSSKPYLMVVNGKPLAYVQSQAAGQRLLEQAGLELSSPYPAEANFRQKAEITYTQEGVPIKSRAADDQTVLDGLKSGIEWLVDGWAIAVGNEKTVFLASKTQAEAVLESVKKSYLPAGEGVDVLSAEFVEAVEFIKEEIPVTNLGNEEQALKTLTEGKEPLREYTVQSGDSFWSISEKNNVSIDELKRINGLTGDNLKIGQVLKLNAPQPLLSVRTTVSTVSQEEIPYGTVYMPNAEAWQGQDKVLEAGSAGTKEVKYEIAQINGLLVEKTVLAETVIAEPVDRVVENGTKTIVASRSVEGSGVSGGALAWPIRGRINSPFGPRSRGFHSGIDIQGSTGDPLYSAAGGTVISASYSGGYGNLVTIDHGNGLSTLYAHLSQMNVSVGQVVGSQELVGLVGTTGRVTGPHLHFEVRIDGSPVNPVDYLS